MRHTYIVIFLVAATSCTRENTTTSVAKATAVRASNLAEIQVDGAVATGECRTVPASVLTFDKYANLTSIALVSKDRRVLVSFDSGQQALYVNDVRFATKLDIDIDVRANRASVTGPATQSPAHRATYRSTAVELLADARLGPMGAVVDTVRARCLKAY